MSRKVETDTIFLRITTRLNEVLMSRIIEMIDYFMNK